MNFFNDVITGQILPAVLQTAIGVLLVIIVAVIKQRLDNHPVKKIWDTILSDAEEQKWYDTIRGNNPKKKLYLVLPAIDMQNIGGFDKQTWQEIPRNISLLLLQEALGISEMIKKLQGIYKDLDIEISTSDVFSNYKSNFICVGGPSVNKVTKALLTKHKIDRYFEVVLPDHYILDRDQQRYVGKWMDNELVRDYGFTFVVRNPLYPSKYCAICLGVWEFGTASAIHVLLGDNIRDPLFTDLTSRLKNGKNILAISQTDIQGIYCSPPKLVKIRECEFDQIPIENEPARQQGKEKDEVNSTPTNNMEPTGA